MASSRQAIRAAVLELMAELPFEKIHVTEICRRAGVSRTTYYRLYYEPRDVVCELLDEFFEGIEVILGPREAPREDPTSPVGLLASHLLTYRSLLQYKANGDMLRTILRSKIAPLLEQRIHSIVSLGYSLVDGRSELTTPERLYRAYAVAGMTYVTCEWLRDGCDVAVDELVAFMLDHGPVRVLRDAARSTEAISFPDLPV